MTMCSSFHQNLLLLMHVVPPTEDFKQHFKERMFNKPNIAGFIHVSHYLLNIYDNNRFRILVKWPIVCITKYRNSVKDFVIIIAEENPDINFPPILMSRLLYASGTKFLTIMWKLSQTSLRKCIERENNHPILYAPKAGPLDNLTKGHLKGMITKKAARIKIMHINLIQMQKNISNTIKEEIEELNIVKKEIFERTESLKNITSKLPLDSASQKSLLDTENTELLQMRKRQVLISFEYLREYNTQFQEIRNLSTKTANAVNRITNKNILNAAQITKIDSSVKLPLPLYDQHLLYDLYKDGKLVLHNFMLLFNSLLKQLYWRLKKFGFQDMSQCLLQLNASTEDLTLTNHLFKNLLTTIKHSFQIATKLRRDLYGNCMSKLHLADTLSAINIDFTLTSPLINIDIDCYDKNDDMQKQFELTPIQGIHKSLFSRYKRINNEPPETNMLVRQINFGDALSGTIEVSHAQSSKITPRISFISEKRSNRYSRLFSSSKKKIIKANFNISPRRFTADPTSLANTRNFYNTLDRSLDITENALLSSSTEATLFEQIPEDMKLEESVFEETASIPKHQSNRIMKPRIDNVIYDKSADNEIAATKINESLQRTSISDLVERYNDLLGKSAK